MAGLGLSKSRIVAWKQCPKRLWLQIHRRDLLETSDGTERGFRIGYEVGEVARSLHPSGILIGEDEDLGAAIESTRMVMAAHPGRPIYEATFQHDGVLVRVDLLLPTAKGYRMVEVKSSTSVKAYQVDDCAIQAWVLAGNGIGISSIELAHVDNSFVYQSGGNYHGLFRHVDLNEEVTSLVEVVPEWVSGARKTLSGDEPPIGPGPQCDDPFECPFESYCTRDMIPLEEPQYTLDIFHRMHESTKDDLRSKGFRDALLVPEEFLTETHQRIQRVSRSGIPELDPAAALSLEALPYPRYYLDFETINMAVPRWAGTSPYRTQVPFQWSCHIEHSVGELRHEMFLETSGNDPRRSCAEELLGVLGNDGPIFVYYQSFEKSRIAELAELFTDLAPALHAVNDRIVDMYPIAKDNYYHPAMLGSWSIKSVLPTIAPELDYASLTVGNGGDAQVAYLEILHPDTPDERKEQLIHGLREYCTLDTLAMVKIAWFFQGYGNEP